MYADLLVKLALALEADDAVSLGEEGVILTDAHIQAGPDLGSALTHEDVAGQHKLTIGTLGPEALAFAVTAVTGGAHTFFMGEKLQIELQHDFFLHIMAVPVEPPTYS